MNDSLTEVLTSIYLAPPGSSLWRWSKQEETIDWPCGTTILFRAELTEVLARLTPQGAPSLNALVLLLAACRDGWQGPAQEAFHGLMAGTPGRGVALEQTPIRRGGFDDTSSDEEAKME